MCKIQTHWVEPIVSGLSHSISERELSDSEPIVVVQTPCDYLEQSSVHEVSQCWHTGQSIHEAHNKDTVY